MQQNLAYIKFDYFGALKNKIRLIFKL